MPMVIACSQLHCAANLIPGNHELLINAKQHLTTASKLAEAYDNTWHSIIWIKSKTAVKRRVSNQLNHIAFDAYSHFLKASDCLSQYAELMNKFGVNCPHWWVSLVSQMNGIYDTFHEENGNELYWRQLVLYD